MSQQPVDPYGTRLPIKLDTTSNGEFVPVPLSRGQPRTRNRLAHERRPRNAKRLGLQPPRLPRLRLRRGEHAARVQRRQRGGRQARRLLRAPAEAALEPQLAAAKLGDGEFIFDVQGHFVDPTGAWVKNAPPDAFKWSPKAACALAKEPGPRSHLALPRARGVREGRVPRQRHRHDGAVLRALAARRRAGHDRGGGRGAPHRRPPARHAPPADARPRQPEPAGRRRGDGRARRSAGA